MKQKITMSGGNSISLKAVWETFVIAQTAKGVSDATITNYHSHLRAIGKHLDIEMPFDRSKNLSSFVRFGCGDFILTNSIAFFYSLGLTSIVTLQEERDKLEDFPLKKTENVI